MKTIYCTQCKRNVPRTFKAPKYTRHTQEFIPIPQQRQEQKWQHPKRHSCASLLDIPSRMCRYPNIIRSSETLKRPLVLGGNSSEIGHIIDKLMTCGDKCFKMFSCLREVRQKETYNSLYVTSEFLMFCVMEAFFILVPKTKIVQEKNTSPKYNKVALFTADKYI